jgi:oxysterol-binding protein-related protein 9/10/11
MLYVLEIYLSSLQRQYYIGRPVKEGTKKPLNPFLGELFLCEYRDVESDANVKVISEQVSHHPPTTACFIEDEKNGVKVSLSPPAHDSILLNHSLG